ncbi:MAG: PfkB family carbohydrate kinase [Kineosporiaceae bacterium]
MTAHLVGVADVIADVVLAVPALPARGGDVLARAASVEAGGSGFNVLVAAGRHGLPGRYAGTHGTGIFGELARRALDAAGVEVLHAAEPDVDTGFTVALVEDDGERTFVTSVGAEARLGAGHLAGVRVARADAVYVSGYDLVYPVSGPAIADWLRGLPPQALVVTDPGPLAADIRASVVTAVAGRTDWLVCAGAEAARLTGVAEPAAAAGALAAGYARGGALVRLGADGCLVAVGGAPPVHVPGYPVTAVDTNGAGDTHTGVFLAALVAGRSPVAAADRANAAAALAVTRRGPATAPTAGEVDAFAPGTRA